jgi:hypothetical protein
VTRQRPLRNRRSQDPPSKLDTMLAESRLHHGDVESAEAFYVEHRDGIVSRVLSAHYRPTTGWALIERFEVDPMVKEKCRVAHREAEKTHRRIVDRLQERGGVHVDDVPPG